MKFKKHNGKNTLEFMEKATTCFDTLAYVASDSLRKGPFTYPDNKLVTMDYIPQPYTDTYHNYGQQSTLTLIVKNREARAYMTAADGTRVGVWTELPPDYFGGQLGIMTYDMGDVIFSNIRVTNIGAGSPPLTGLCEDPSMTCDQRLGLCCKDGQCVVPTPAPTMAPTWGAQAMVPNSDICPGPVGGSAYEPLMRLTSFDLVEHEMLSEPCVWEESSGGITQTSNAWGNPGDNSLMGCIALERNSYTNFIAEMDVDSYDNDGVGFIFGFQSLDDHYVAVAINDIWPQPAADQVGGPFIKIKKRRSDRPCLDKMNQFNTCFDTLAWMDKTGSTHQGGPFNYDRVYPYQAGDDWQFMTMTLIVKNRQVRFLFKSPSVDNYEPINNLRMGNKFTSTWTVDLPPTYKGGRIGIMTYAHQATFTNMKITDLGRSVNGYCHGDKDVYCDSGVSGLCLGVPIADVCPNPVGAHMIDTGVITNFEFVDDQYLYTPCQWEITQDNRLVQTSNANKAGADPTLVGCNALIRGTIYDDFIAQVTIENHDNDAVGFGTFALSRFFFVL